MGAAQEVTNFLHCAAGVKFSADSCSHEHSTAKEIFNFLFQILSFSILLSFPTSHIPSNAPGDTPGDTPSDAPSHVPFQNALMSWVPTAILTAIPTATPNHLLSFTLMINLMTVICGQASCFFLLQTGVVPSKGVNRWISRSTFSCNQTQTCSSAVAT